jgi:hypothetical protein
LGIDPHHGDTDAAQTFSFELQCFTATGRVHANLGVAVTGKARRLGNRSRAWRRFSGAPAVDDLLVSWG